MATDRLGWKVTGVATDQTVTDSANNVAIGAYVSYITANGNRGTVFVDNDHFKPERVKADVHRDARNLDAIAALADNYTEG